MDKKFISNNIIVNTLNEENTMKKLNITKKQFNESNYFQKKYGTLKYVSESGKIYKTSKGHLLKFINESQNDVTIDDFKRMYGKNAAEALNKYCVIKNKEDDDIYIMAHNNPERNDKHIEIVLHDKVPLLNVREKSAF